LNNRRYFSFKGSTAFKRGSTAFVRAATAPAISYRASYRLPLKDFQWKNVDRRESQIIGLCPHQGNKNVSKDKRSSNFIN
jgi:hypothetical protein